MAEKKYDSLTHLKNREAIRAVPGMYVGGLGSHAAMHLLFEVADNAIDEALAGYCKNISVTLSEDDAITVSDDGRGIPSKKDDEGVSFLNRAFDVHSGGKFAGQTNYKRSGGLNGVGIALVAALSDRVDAVSYRDGLETWVHYHRGEYGVFDGEGASAKFIPKPDTFIIQRKDSRSATEKKARPTGTTIRFWIDHEFMDEDEDEVGQILPATVDFDRIVTRFEDTSYLVPGLKINLSDHRDPENLVDKTFHNPLGIEGMIEDMLTAPKVGEVCTFSGTAQYTTRGEEKGLTLDVAMVWENSLNNHCKSFTNIIRTPQGGTHVNGFLRGLLQVVQEQARRKNVLKAKDPELTEADVTEGLNYMVSVSVPRPTYSGQTKEKMTEAPVLNLVKNITIHELTEWFTARGNSAPATAILEKVVSAARSRRARENKFSIKDIQAEPDKQAVLGLKPDNLKDCVVHGPNSGAELFIVEGQSALGSLLQARDSKYQALYPLRGKPRNFYGLSPQEIFLPPEIKSPKTSDEKKKAEARKKFLNAGQLLLQNKEFDEITQILGAGFGSEFNLENRRFDRVFISSDADIDGLHIATLIVTNFFLYFREFIEDGRLFITQPPLYVISYGDKKNPQYVYAATSLEKDEAVRKLRSEKQKIIDVGRRKGLGESPAEEMAATLMNPKTRVVRQVTLDDFKKTEDMLEVMFGMDTSLRKDWLTDPKNIKKFVDED